MYNTSFYSGLLRVLLAAGLCILLSLPATAATSIKEIQSLAEQGKFRQALGKTDELLAADPDNIEGRFYKGLLLTKSNDLQQAEEVFQSLIKDHPDLPEPYNNLAVVYAAQGKYDKARELLSQAIYTHPSYATAHENLGDIYAKMASRAYNQVLELDDNNESAREKLLLINELFSRPVPIQKPVAEKKPEPEPEPEPEVVAVAPEPAPQQSKPAPEPEVVSKPASPPAPEPEPAVDPGPEILSAVNGWAAAWSAQDVDSYLAHYASTYIPAKGMSRAQWKSQRQTRLSRPDFIKVNITSPEVTVHGDNHAEVTFTQSYQSDTYSDRVKKNLLLVRENDRWLIAEERSR